MRFVPLTTFGNYIEANIALSMLEEQGINCHIVDENSVTIMNMASGIRLMVYETQVERAAAIIKEAEKAWLQSLSCPNCHQPGFEINYVAESHEAALRKMPFGRFIALMAKAFSAEGTTLQVKRYVCIHCHKEFTDLPS